MWLKKGQFWMVINVVKKGHSCKFVRVVKKR